MKCDNCCTLILSSVGINRCKYDSVAQSFVTDDRSIQSELGVVVVVPTVVVVVLFLLQIRRRQVIGLLSDTHT